MSNPENHHSDDLQWVIDRLRAARPQVSALELDDIRRRVSVRVAAPARTQRSASIMKSRLVTLTMLVFGMLLSTTGAGLAISGLSTTNAVDAQYGPKPPQTTTTTTTPPAPPAPPATQVLPQLPEEEEVVPEAAPTPSTEVAPEVRSETPAAAPAAEQPLQPSRQVAAAADEGELPFTGLAAIPILVGGIALLGGGAVLRRKTRD